MSGMSAIQILEVARRLGVGVSLVHGGIALTGERTSVELIRGAVAQDRDNIAAALVVAAAENFLNGIGGKCDGARGSGDRASSIADRRMPA